MHALPYDMSLRLATVDDTGRIYALMTEATDAAVGYPNHWGTYQDIQKHLEGWITDSSHLVLLLCSAEDLAVGIFVGSKLDSPFLFHPWASELLWWVSPEGRKGRNPFRMLEAFEVWAGEKNCVYIQVSLPERYSRKKKKRLNRIYRRKGFRPTEKSYTKELN